MRRVDAKDAAGFTPLMQLAEGPNQRPDLVTLLLEAGADVYATNRFGQTPLMIAVHYGCKEIIELLIKCAARLVPMVSADAFANLRASILTSAPLGRPLARLCGEHGLALLMHGDTRCTVTAGAEQI